MPGDSKAIDGACRRRMTPLHVGGEHRHVLALAFEGGLRLQDFVGELRGSGGGGPFRGLSDALSAVSAELLPRLVLRFAGGADERELSAAMSTEPSAGSILPATL
jgi:hypothetical protein